MAEIIYTQPFRFDKIIEFIDNSIMDLTRIRFHDGNIVILLPPHYYLLYEIYVKEIYFNSFINFKPSFLKDLYRYKNIEILFLSPENKCYVMAKDYSYSEDKNLLRHSLCLDNFTTK